MTADMIQAFGIFSGGLDSLLAARLLMDQGLVPTLITFACPFFPDIERAAASARALGLPLTASDLYDDLLPLVKNPPHGHGRCLNPCIDCHAL
ncbi:MAG: tRNA 4-thiouridine(8) synthase ThiI, partial [Candidatus Adiutrix sp.]|nr:tRNA 4-thiouridine(8) synthase ThiI [Candidatus Adiutrix sp.]